MHRNSEAENFYDPSLDPQFNKRDENTEDAENSIERHEKHNYEDMNKMPYEICNLCMKYHPIMEDTQSNPYEMEKGQMNPGMMGSCMHYHMMENDDPSLVGMEYHQRPVYHHYHHHYHHHYFYPHSHPYSY